MDERGESRSSERALALAEAHWPAKAASLRVFVVAEGRHRCRAEVRYEEDTIVAAGAWGKVATMESLIGCLEAPSPPSPWTYHARRAQTAERGQDWTRASQEWRQSEQAVATFGGADKAQLAGMRKRERSATSVPSWLHEHDGAVAHRLDWYLTEASAASGRGDEMLELALCRRAWSEASREWRTDGYRDTDRLDRIIQTAKRLEQDTALA